MKTDIRENELSSEDSLLRGVVFNIQRYSTHDGPGIRTTVFLKGCPLRCFWCQNPESQRKEPEIFLDKKSCTRCGRCVDSCPTGASTLSAESSTIDRTKCTGCGTCAEVCPNEARKLVGKHSTPEEVFKEVEADTVFYRRSGGGVTLSGGEPATQPDFATGLLKLCKNAGIHTALDTCGYVRWETLRQVLDYVDLVLYDFKHMDPEEHKKYTGVSNSLILENAKKIYHECSIPMLARIPVLPGYNDSVENIEATARFISTELGKSVGIHLLSYHRLGEAKYEKLERADNSVSITPPDEEYVLELKRIIESFGLTAHLGG